MGWFVLFYLHRIYEILIIDVDDIVAHTRSSCGYSDGVWSLKVFIMQLCRVPNRQSRIYQMQMKNSYRNSLHRLYWMLKRTVMHRFHHHNHNHPRLGDHLDFCSRSSDVSVNPMPRVQLTRLEMIEPVFASKGTARNVGMNVTKVGSRCPRLVDGRENMVSGYPADMCVLVVDAARPQGLVGATNSCQETKKKGNNMSPSENPLRPKSVLAPRAPFGEIINDSIHRAPKNQNRSF